VERLQQLQLLEYLVQMQLALMMQLGQQVELVLQHLRGEFARRFRYQ
jgi:hypothetical protein